MIILARLFSRPLVGCDLRDLFLYLCCESIAIAVAWSIRAVTQGKLAGRCDNISVRVTRERRHTSILGPAKGCAFRQAYGGSSVSRDASRIRGCRILRGARP